MKFSRLLIALGASLTLAHAAEHFPVLDPSFEFRCSPQEKVGCSGLFPVHPADEAQMALLINGERSLAARIRLLKSARRSIRIQALIFTGDESGITIAKILKQKKKEGLDVRVIVDAFSNYSAFRGFWALVGGQTQWMLFDLKQNGIEVEGYEALFLQWWNELRGKSIPDMINTANKRYHDKMWVIDGEEPYGTAILGGMNVANEYFRTDSEQKMIWRDQDVLVRGKVVADITTAFDRDYQWFKAIKKEKAGIFNTDVNWDILRKIQDKTGRPTIPFVTSEEIMAKIQGIVAKYEIPNTVPTRMRFIQSRPRLGESFIHQAYTSMLGATESKAQIANAYFVPKGELVESIRGAALRGAKVEVLTNSFETNDLPMLSYVGRYLYKNILSVNFEPDTLAHSGGVSIHEWDGPSHGEGTIHAKYAVFDSKAGIIGSYNLDPRSELLNSETVLVFENQPLATELATQYEDHDLAMGVNITWDKALEFHEPKDIAEKFKVLFSLPLTDWL